MAHGLDRCEVSVMIPFDPTEPWSGSIIGREPDTGVEMMAHIRLTIHLQERLRQFTSLSYNEMASAAIDQERMMKAIAEVDEKKRKKMMPGSASSGSSSGAPPKCDSTTSEMRGLSPKIISGDS
jgi:hypothetical protein